MQDTIIQIKRRRLDAEIERLEYDIDFTQQMIKHDPYPQDIPGLKKQLAELQEDLKAAKAESNQEIIDHHHTVRGTKKQQAAIDAMQAIMDAVPKVGAKEARRIVRELQATAKR